MKLICSSTLYSSWENPRVKVFGTQDTVEDFVLLLLCSMGGKERVVYGLFVTNVVGVDHLQVEICDGRF